MRRSLKRNKSIDDITRSSKENKRTYLTRSSTKNKTIRGDGETIELPITGDLHLESTQCFWSKLSEQVASKLSKSVVSLALSNGHKVLFKCSGIAVQREGHVTRFLTSASLAKALIDKREHHDNLKIEVRHGDNVAIGFLGEYDVDCNITAVNVKNSPDVQTVSFMDLLEFPPHGNVVALGHDTSGKLIATSGILNSDLSGSASSLMTTCKISKVCEGGPLFDCDGNFLGMNISFSTEGTLFMPNYEVLETLWNCCASLKYVKFPKESRAKESFNGEMPNSHKNARRTSLSLLAAPLHAPFSWMRRAALLPIDASPCCSTESAVGKESDLGADGNSQAGATEDAREKSEAGEGRRAQSAQRRRMGSRCGWGETSRVFPMAFSVESSASLRGKKSFPDVETVARSCHDACANETRR